MPGPVAAQGAEGEGVMDAEEGPGPAPLPRRSGPDPVGCPPPAASWLALSLSSPADTMAVRILIAATSADKLLDGRPTGCWCAWLSAAPAHQRAASALSAACQLLRVLAPLSASVPPASVLPTWSRVEEVASPYLMWREKGFQVRRRGSATPALPLENMAR